MVQIEQIGESKSFGGWTRMFQHDSQSCSCIMKFSVFLPAQIENGPVPVLTWLSGLTCTHENFITKAGAQKFAAEHEIMLVAPTQVLEEWEFKAKRIVMILVRELAFT